MRRSEPRKIERLFTLVLFLHQIYVQANVQYKDKEDELSALSRRIMLLETESNGADVKLAKTTMEVSIISQILVDIQTNLLRFLTECFALSVFFKNRCLIIMKYTFLFPCKLMQKSPFNPIVS